MEILSVCVHCRKEYVVVLLRNGTVSWNYCPHCGGGNHLWLKEIYQGDEPAGILRLCDYCHGEYQIAASGFNHCPYCGKDRDLQLRIIKDPGTIPFGILDLEGAEKIQNKTS